MVGVNCFTESAESPLAAGDGRLSHDRCLRPKAAQIARLQAHRARRDDDAAVAPRSPTLRRAAGAGEQHHAGLDRVRARRRHDRGMGGSTARRYSANTGRRPGVSGARPQSDEARLAGVRARVDRLDRARLRRRPKMLVGKPGLDGHSNGAEQIALCARDCGFEVVYDGIRLTPARIAVAALEEGVHVVGPVDPLRVAPGAGRRGAGAPARPRAWTMSRWWSAASSRPRTRAELLAGGVAQVFTPKDYDPAEVMAEIVEPARGTPGSRAA